LVTEAQGADNLLRLIIQLRPNRESDPNISWSPDLCCAQHVACGLILSQDISTYCILICPAQIVFHFSLIFPTYYAWVLKWIMY